MWCVLQYEWGKCAWKIVKTCKRGRSIENCKAKMCEETWRKALYGTSSCKVEKILNEVGETSRWTSL